MFSFRILLQQGHVTSSTFDLQAQLKNALEVESTGKLSKTISHTKFRITNFISHEQLFLKIIAKIIFHC